MVKTQFSSRLGFVLTAAGSAVGLGNIWGFPTQAAQHGGGAFLLLYLLLVFALAYPALVAEMAIGRRGHQEPIADLGSLAGKVGKLTGWLGLLAVSAILSFYLIIAGWLLGYMSDALLRLVGVSWPWLTTFSLGRNLILGLLFGLITWWVVQRGLQEGIEKWSKRLMPALLVVLIALACYVLTLPGGSEGLSAYLTPDPQKLLAPNLWLAATGQAFFSLSIGVCVMMVYASYLDKDASLPRLGLQVTLIDSGIAFLAGLLVIPTLYVAKAQGLAILDAHGQLISSDTLVFDLFPRLFATMGSAGLVLSFGFFLLLAVAALTSTLSMLEVPTASLVARTGSSRRVASAWVLGLVLIAMALICWQFGTLFGLVVKVVTQYAQPLLGLVFCVYVGWLWRRDSLLKALAAEDETFAKSWFWRLWPGYVKLVCPLLILLVMVQSIQ
ncbi:sodium-dependent transporter [Gallaecimonas pentaromativorans]|uniref:NSS family neurotransmitter:Na+ symporter n=1 Tax=Gallaecimonas pentaromativorans TaxID=584787 RepID=A0A3N1PHU5_9GAMM|nr:sodium-dependent transporter [Gallaecimonas pentaromativorans]ROQ27388.1 NSS family neurotransmitter:Na+ symporter [Gallaecimonas pentaromativorans]